MKYNDIKTPQELLNFMSKIKYGYLTKDNIIKLNDNLEWYNTYKLQSIKEILNNMIGACWDQVELERDWFTIHNYEIKTYYEQVLLNYKNNYTTHSFLVYKDNNKWNWFENAFETNKGIHTFNSLEELLIYEKNKYIESLKEQKISDKELNKIIIKEFSKPTSNINAKEYIDRIIGD